MSHDRLMVISVAGFVVNLIGLFAFQHGGAGMYVCVCVCAYMWTFDISIRYIVVDLTYMYMYIHAFVCAVCYVCLYIFIRFSKPLRFSKLVFSKPLGL